MIIAACYFILAKPAQAIGYNYDYSNDVYYKIKQKEDGQSSEIVKIDFKNRSYSKIVASNNYTVWLNLSPNKKLLNYFTDGKLNIFDLENRKVVFSLALPAPRTVIWSGDSKRISFRDTTEKKIIEIELDKPQVVKVSCECDVWKTKWNDDKKLFFYELSIPGGGYYGDSEKASVYRIHNGKLIKINHITSFTASPGGKYYYRLTYGEDDSYFYLYRSNGDKIGQYVSLGYVLLDNDSKTLWTKGRLRIAGLNATFNLNNGNVYNTHFFWREGNEPKKLYQKKDRAIDRGGRYILMWNKDKKQFEVEDINTEKIVKTYKKFW